jgi:hypothetical protein
MNWRLSFKDFLLVLLFFFISYFFIRGFEDWRQEKIVCTFVENDYYYFLTFNYSVRLNLNEVKTFTNESGLFNNNIILNNNQHLLNCSFIFY